MSELTKGEYREGRRLAKVLKDFCHLSFRRRMPRLTNNTFDQSLSAAEEPRARAPRAALAWRRGEWNQFEPRPYDQAYLSFKRSIALAIAVN